MGHGYFSIVLLFICLNLLPGSLFPQAALPLPAGRWLLNVHTPVCKTKPQTMFTLHSPSWSLLQGRWSHNKNYTLGAHIRSKTPLHEINPKPHLKKQGLLDLVIIQVPHEHFGPHFASGETPSHLPTGTDLSRMTVLVSILQPPLPTGSPLVSFHFLNVRKQARTIVGSPLAATSKTHSAQRYPQKLLWWRKSSLSELPNMVATSHRWQVSAWSVTSWLRKWIFLF